MLKVCVVLLPEDGFAPADTRIGIRSRRVEGSVRPEVIDEGDGIAPAEEERIFDKFYRARKADRVRAGTGLGLAISRGFIEAMGGTIAASNRRDRSGAVFTIDLPIPASPQQGAAGQ